MNRLLEIDGFLKIATICQWFVLLHNKINEGPEGFTAFNCIDFRQVGTDTLNHNHTQNAHVQEICRSKFEPQLKHFMFWMNEEMKPHSHFKKYIDTELAHLQTAVSLRSLNAYLGLEDNVYACQECTKTPGTREIVVYIRGEDVFDSSLRKLWKYGQPPLDYYNKSIHHAIESIGKDEMIHILLVSKDWKNPVASFFQNSNMFDGDSRISLSVEVGEPYIKVLRQLYCAETLILAVSSMDPIIGKSPNSKRLYLPRDLDDYESPMVCRSEEHLNASDTYTSSYDLDPGREVYVYNTDNKYVGYQNWKIDLEELMNFDSGYLTRCDLDIFAKH